MRKEFIGCPAVAGFTTKEAQGARKGELIVLLIIRHVGEKSGFGERFRDAARSRLVGWRIYDRKDTTNEKEKPTD